MLHAILSFALIAGMLPLDIGANAPATKCLPAEIDPGSIVVVETTRGGTARVSLKTRLTQLKARCKKGKLYAGGRQIYFYNLIGCWGNPPDDYQEQLRRQAAELQRLKKKYTVIQIACDGSVDPRRIS
jgi:hypothetical protein